MNCEDIQELVGVYTDGELPQAEQCLVEQHSSGCKNCQTLIKDAQELSALIRSNPRFVPPLELPTLITEKLDAADRELKPRVWYRRPAFLLTNVAAMAAGIVLTMLITQNLSTQEAITGTLITAHMRHSVRQEFGIIASSDRHTIRPWFTGKIDYAPPVFDLAEAGFPLLTGRVEYVNGRAIAALTYGKRKHRISLFIFPLGEDSISRSLGMSTTDSSRGFNITVWNGKDFSFSAISDVNANDLSTFADLLRVAFGEH